MKFIVTALSVFWVFLLTACNSRGELSGTMTTSSYNYTTHNLYDISLKDATQAFDVAAAPRAGSVFFRNSSSALLDGGEKYQFSFADCCFMRDKHLRAPTKLRLVWSVVYDLDLFEGESGRDYDDRANKGAAPGSRWCSAVIDVPGPAPADADNLSLHFLPDGTVIGSYGKAQAPAPLTSAQVRAHATPMPKGQYCKQETTNPWFGIPRTPHRE
ncbi:hypothetical protein Jab_2c10130 [Janthinobacterium sp. HH01]|uniref:DUF3304 domain-containing protein n=1 Tax=Janthinobacterium sp. HH01 TaxID=1198452 RepID=UPI0002AEDA76|nr:DUF3304 domain-containing protein [Janthinobacterium sp. HH01]ELX08955.1 hypothetical protein Jab_2c10130 [Janthinobacterium sp. HH01]